MAAKGAVMRFHGRDAGDLDHIPCSRRDIIRQVVMERKRQHLTQKDLADRIGLKQSNISRLETGKSNPSIDFLQRVAVGLGKELHVEIR